MPYRDIKNRQKIGMKSLLQQVNYPFKKNKNCFDTKIIDVFSFRISLVLLFRIVFVYIYIYSLYENQRNMTRILTHYKYIFLT